MTHERNNIRTTSGYVPGEQPDAGGVVKLNTNENPYPPCEAVMRALREVPGEALRRYPPPTARQFCQTAAQVHGVEPGNVIAVNGGDELLRLTLTTFVEPGRPVGMAEPSYSLYPVLAEIHDSPVTRAGLDSDWQLPNDFAAQMNETGAAVTFVVNPHAPSGRLTSTDELARIADELNGVLVIDEAYVDFVDPDLGYDAVELVRRFDNVLILRTLSKGYSLAGLRFGYGLGAATLIEPMLKAKDSYNTDVVAQTLAITALTHRDEAAGTWQAVRDERTKLVKDLALLGLACPPSQANFVLPAVPDNPPGAARSVYESLKARNILVRYFDQERLRDRLRITVGTEQQNAALLGALREVLSAS